MDNNRLIDLRKKKVENKLKQHKELLDSNASIKEAILSLNDTINTQEPVNLDALSKQLQELIDSQTYGEDIKNLETVLRELSDKEKLDEIIQAIGEINNQDVVKAVNSLIEKITTRTIDQSPEQYQPVRRVRKIGQRLVFDDDPLQVTVNGGAMGGGGVPTFRDNKGRVTQVTLTSEGKVPVEITDELGGIATSAKQLPNNHQVTVSNQLTDFATSTNQTNGSQKTQIVEKEPTDTTKLNPSVSITEVTVGTVTTKTITKTIGTDVYQKTVAIDSSDNSINISAWSKL